MRVGVTASSGNSVLSVPMWVPWTPCSKMWSSAGTLTAMRAEKKWLALRALTVWSCSVE